MSRFVTLFLVFFLATGLAAQQPDSANRPAEPDSTIRQDTTRQQDTLPPPAEKDSQLVKVVPDVSILQPVHLYSFVPGQWQLMATGTDTKPEPARVKHLPEPERRHAKGKELLFYALVMLFIIIGVLRRAFPKYFNDLFRLFFRTTLKQKQIREQLMQTPLPSLLLNGYFVLSLGLYIAFMLRHFSIDPLGNFWLLALYGCLGLSAAYFVKFAGLKICGWLFNMEEAADAYIFIVFIINKMIGILLLPFLLIIAFSTGRAYDAGLTLSWCLIGVLLIYRVILTYGTIRNQVKLNPFHFFLYICAFEIAPLLLVYKALMIFFNQTA